MVLSWVGIVSPEAPRRLTRRGSSLVTRSSAVTALVLLPALPVLDHRDGVDHQGEDRHQERPSGFVHLTPFCCRGFPSNTHYFTLLSGVVQPFRRVKWGELCCWAISYVEAASAVADARRTSRTSSRR